MERPQHLVSEKLIGSTFSHGLKSIFIFFYSNKNEQLISERVTALGLLVASKQCSLANFQRLDCIW